MEGIRFETAVRIGANGIFRVNATLYHKSAAQLSAAEALALKNLFQCHFHNGIVKEFCHKNAKIVFMSLYV